MVVVDDLSIIAPSGEAFDLNDDFALPKGSKFYSDLNAPEGAPSRAERIAKQQREQPRQQAQAQAQRSAAAPAESAEEVALDDPHAGGPPLLNNTGYYQPAPTYSARYQDYPAPAVDYAAPAPASYWPAYHDAYASQGHPYASQGHPYAYQGRGRIAASSIGHLPPQHQESITKQLGGMAIAGGNAGYGQGYAPARPYAPAVAASYGYGEPAYGSYGYAAPWRGRGYAY